MSTAHPVAAIELPIPVEELAQRSRQLEMEHGRGLTIKQHGSHLIIYTPGDPFDGCLRCLMAEAEMIRALIGDRWPPAPQFMVLCPECGNKRCPRATDHLNACTRSNEPGQPGSAYS